MDESLSVCIWHNPRCTKSRAALARLEEAFPAEQVSVVRYLDAPPDRATLARVAALVSGGAAALLRAKEALAADLGVDASTDPERILDVLAAHPALIERPVLIGPGGACIARSAEALEGWIARARSSLQGQGEAEVSR